MPAFSKARQVASSSGGSGLTASGPGGGQSAADCTRNRACSLGIAHETAPRKGTMQVGRNGGKRPHGVLSTPVHMARIATAEIDGPHVDLSLDTEKDGAARVRK